MHIVQRFWCLWMIPHPISEDSMHLWVGSRMDFLDHPDVVGLVGNNIYIYI